MTILAAVGTQFSFDRMINAVDDWAEAAGRRDVIAQIGPSGYVPRALQAHSTIAPDAFAKLQREASAIVAHAGMGSILGALEAGKPIIIMPRRHALGEHRNDHQLATAARFADVPGVHVAADETELRSLLDRIDSLTGPDRTDLGASPELVERLRAFVAEARPRGLFARRTPAA